MKYEEHDLQVWFCQLLQLYENQGKLYYFAIPNGDRRGGNEFQAMLTGKRLKQEGTKAGVADLCILIKDAVIFIEMKSQQGKQSRSQKEFEKIVKNFNHNYIVLHNQEECEQFIRAITDKGDFQNL